jgi:ABC-type antimicrobial peptide transport system permease subunit
MVVQRTQELGVRQALGASPRDLGALVLRDGSRLALLGGTIGLIGAFLLSRLGSRLLYGIGTFDLPTFVGVPLLVLGAAGLACWLPARRAIRTDPLEAMRAKL